MAGFLTTSGTSFQIERIMIDAKKELVLISPYLKLSKTFFERLQDASKKGVLVKIIYGKDELKSSEEKQIKSLENIELYFSENLHAKCYYNETEMVITSMNMYEFSEKNNREMGVHITRNQDRKVFDNAVEESKSIQNNSEIRFKSANINVSLPTTNKAFTDSYTNNTKLKEKEGVNATGVCIRCGDSLKLNPLSPMCLNCYKIWVQSRDINNKEKFCHKCKVETVTSISKPLCHGCFTDLSLEEKQKLIKGSIFI